MQRNVRFPLLFQVRSLFSAAHARPVRSGRCTPCIERQFRRLSTRPPLTNCAPFLAVWFWHVSCCPLVSCFRPNFLFRSSTVSVRHSHLHGVVGTILLLAFNTGVYGGYGRSPVPRARFWRSNRPISKYCKYSKYCYDRNLHDSVPLYTVFMLQAWDRFPRTLKI